MSAELIAILAAGISNIGVMVALAGLFRASLQDLSARTDRLETNVDRRFEQVEHRIERLEAGLAAVGCGQAKLEGLLEGLR